jgi:hypothetical protein
MRYPSQEIPLDGTLISLGYNIVRSILPRESKRITINMMHLKFSEEFCVKIDPWASDRPICCLCNIPVDWYGRKIEMDRLAGLTPNDSLRNSRSYNMIYVVRCHGSSGLINMSQMPNWNPFLDSRPSIPDAVRE